MEAFFTAKNNERLCLPSRPLGVQAIVYNGQRLFLACFVFRLAFFSLFVLYSLALFLLITTALPVLAALLIIVLSTSLFTRLVARMLILLISSALIFLGTLFLLAVSFSRLICHDVLLF